MIPLMYAARMWRRDDLVDMRCKRVASTIKKTKAWPEEIRLQQRTVSERWIDTYRAALEHLDPDSETPGRAPGGVVRAMMFELIGNPELIATSSDASVPAALEHAQACHTQRRDFIPLPAAARRRVPPCVNFGELVRRGYRQLPPGYGGPAPHRGEGVFTHSTHLGRTRAAADKFCDQVDLPTTAAGFLQRPQHTHPDTDVDLDAGYEDNTNLVIRESGVLRLKWFRSTGAPGCRAVGQSERTADVGALAVVDRGTHRALVGPASPLRADVRLRPQAQRPAKRVLHGSVSSARPASARTRWPGTSPGSRRGSCRWCVTSTSIWRSSVQPLPW